MIVIADTQFNYWLKMLNNEIQSTNCIDKDYFLYGILSIKLAIESKLKDIIGLKKPAAIDSEINIQLVDIRYFFCIKIQWFPINLIYQHKQLQVL